MLNSQEQTVEPYESPAHRLQECWFNAVESSLLEVVASESYVFLPNVKNTTYILTGDVQIPANDSRYNVTGMSISYAPCKRHGDSAGSCLMCVCLWLCWGCCALCVLQVISHRALLRMCRESARHASIQRQAAISVVDGTST